MRLSQRGALTLLAIGLAACQASSSTPPELAKLEREVGLELAHVRDAGPTAPEQRRALQQAASLDSEAEHALQTGDYRTAEDKFVRAQTILRQLD